MLFTLIVSAAAGFATPMVVPHVAQHLGPYLGPDGGRSGTATHMAAFGLMMLAAAIVMALADSDGSPVVMMVGGLLGLFHKEIRQAVAGRR